MQITKRIHACIVALLVLFTSGCQSQTPPVPPPAAVPENQPPKKLVKLFIQFDGVPQAAQSRTELGPALEGFAKVENGPFVLESQPYVRIAVSVPPTVADADVVKKIQSLPGVRQVKLE